MRPDPFHDVLAFLGKPAWYTGVFDLLLVASVAIVVLAWRRYRTQRTLPDLGIWLLRVLVGAMWWQQSLWKIPPDYGGLVYWMKQVVDHGAVPLQSRIVETLMIPHISVFGPVVYLLEVAIGVSLILGLLTRLGAALGALEAIYLWLGLYSAPGEWPWTYFFLIVIQILFTMQPPGRRLGADALLMPRTRRLSLVS